MCADSSRSERFLGEELEDPLVWPTIRLIIPPRLLVLILAETVALESGIYIDIMDAGIMMRILRIIPVLNDAENHGVHLFRKVIHLGTLILRHLVATRGSRPVAKRYAIALVGTLVPELGIAGHKELEVLVGFPYSGHNRLDSIP